MQREKKRLTQGRAGWQRWAWIVLACAWAIVYSGGAASHPSKASTSGDQAATKVPAHMLAMGMRTPALSPDGQHIAFGYQGDIWRVAARGGNATRLTVHPAYDSRPRWSPDGKQILFTSKRSGSSDVYVLQSSGSPPRRLTHHSALDIGLDWSPDGKQILFESNRENIRSLYKISATGGMPQRLIPGYWNLAFGGRVGPKGHRLLVSEGLEGLSYWWRKGYRGPNHGRVHLFDTRTNKSQQLSKGPHSELWPMWDKQGQAMYFVSDEAGLPNLWRSSFDGKQRKAITNFSKGAVRWPAINRGGTHIVYERNFRIWLTALKSGRSWQVPVQISSDSPKNFQRWLTAKKVTEFALSPDGKKLAFIMEGEVFVTDANGRTSIRRLTNTIWREHQVQWDKDSLHVTYTSERGRGFLLVRRSALADGQETILLRSQKMLLYPRRSPDGKHLVYLEGKNRWMLLKKGAKKPTLLAEAQIGGLLNDPPQWSPDSKWIMYLAYQQGRGSLWAKHIDPKRPALRLTRTAAHDGDGAWTPDGKYILYRSNRYGSDWFHKVGDTDIYSLALHPQKQRFREDKLDKLFKTKKPKRSKVPSGKAAPRKPAKRTLAPKAPKAPKAPTTPKKPSVRGKAPIKPGVTPPPKRPKQALPPRPAPRKPAKRAKPAPKKGKKGKKGKKAKKKRKPVKVQERGLKYRVRRVTAMKGNEGWPIPGPRGKQVLFFSNSMGRYQLYLARFKHGRLVGARPIAKRLRFRGVWSPHYLQWHPKGKAAYILQRGAIVKISLPKGRTKRLNLRYRMQIDRQSRFTQTFREVWLVLRDHFYDPKMNGQNWDALYARFLPAIHRVQTPEDWRALVNEMLGFLNASHLGAWTKRSRPLYHTGMLGTTLEAKGKHLVLARIFARGPIHKVMPKLKDGEARLIAIQGQHVSAERNPYPRLLNTRGKRLYLTLSLPGKTKGDPRIKKKIKVRPIGHRQARRLRYYAWVEERKALVKRWSKGRVGYLHMPNMGRGALRNFIRDFETDVANKGGAIIDLRFNFGGNVHDSVLQYLSRRRYASWGLRGLKRWAEPGHAALPGKMAMMINEGSLSDAEMTANGFKALKLGTLVGMPTYRWLIFTYSGSLLGGGGFRIPEWGCYTRSGKDLEKVGVTPHVRVKNTFDDRVHNRDPQLKKTIELLRKK